jgi:hypothetical protein
LSSIKLEPETTKTKIQPFDIINHEHQKEKHATNQFFSSLLERHYCLLLLSKTAFAQACAVCSPVTWN